MGFACIVLSRITRFKTLTLAISFPSTNAKCRYFPPQKNSFSGEKTLQKKVPDTITSWIITGFSVNPIYGLGLTQQPRKLNVFLPFFVSTNLPYSVKRGEVVAIPIVVFNYMEDDQTAEVVLHNDEQEFEFADVENEVVESNSKFKSLLNPHLSCVLRYCASLFS